MSEAVDNVAKRKRDGGAKASRSGVARNANVAGPKPLEIGDSITARICRFDPTTDTKPRYETYEVPYVQWMRVLDVLNYLVEEKDVELAHPWYCGTEKCGHCAVRVNGREVLACWESAEREMLIEPLRHLPVVRDLVVDRKPYEDAIVRLQPWLVRAEPYRGFPEIISDRTMQSASAALDCISCMACNSVCPVLNMGDLTTFVGPGPIVQMAQTALDPRDGLDRGKLALHEGGILDCVSCYKCDEVCPVDIPIVDTILEPLKAKARMSEKGAQRPTGTVTAGELPMFPPGA